jgi:hypothetical protein
LHLYRNRFTLFFVTVSFYFCFFKFKIVIVSFLFVAFLSCLSLWVFFVIFCTFLFYLVLHLTQHLPPHLLWMLVVCFCFDRTNNTLLFSQTFQSELLQGISCFFLLLKANQTRFFSHSKLSNGYSRANLANLSTCRKFTIFGEFEYSPKWLFLEMCRTCKTHRHLPNHLPRTRQTRRHSPSHLPRACQTRRHSPNHLPRTRQTHERWVWQVLREFGEFGELGKFGECRVDHFIHIKYVFSS